MCEAVILKRLMLIEIKGYVKHAEHQLEKYVGCDGRNEDEINPNEKINDVYGCNPCPC